MKKAIIYIVAILIIIFGLFFAIYYRQPLGFYVVGAAVIAIIYFIFFE